MKELKFSLFLLIAAVCFSGCDYVETPNLDTPAPANGSRRALIMDFTGHKCSNCPGGARIANEIAQEFPNHVYVLAIHPEGGIFTEADPNGTSFQTDWKTPEGINYQNWFQVQTLPSGSVSGINTDGDYIISAAGWQEAISELIYQNRQATVEFDITYDATSREINVTGEVEFMTDLEGDYNLILATVETNREDWQVNGSSEFPSDDSYPGGSISNYIHKHVLRNHINGLEGELISSNAVNGEIQEFSASSILDSNFNEEECSIMGFVYDTDTKEILDVVENYIIP